MSIKSPNLNGLLALSIGASGALLFIYLGMSLPWVLGSMMACATLSLFGVPLRIPKQWRSYALAVIGTILGSSFDMQTLKALPGWSITISLVLLMTVFYLLCSYRVLLRWSGMDRLTALFSAIPGGLAIITALSDLYQTDTRRIGLSHSARLVALLALTPFLLKYVGQYELPSSSIPTLTQAGTVTPWLDYILLFACAAGGYTLAKALNFPTGVLLFPIVFSAIAHVSGGVSSHVPAPAAALAQAIIGTTVGVRFVGYRWRDIIQDGWLSIIIGVLLALLSMLAALTVSYFSGMDFAPLLLVFLPGGAPELGVMAIALDIDPAMVTTHHMLRVLAIVGGISLLLNRFIQAKT